MTYRILSAALISAFAVGCASKKSPEAVAEPEIVNASINTNIEAPIARGDCKEAVRRALARPDLDVERVPAPLAMIPAPIDSKKMPKSVPDKNGYYQVQFQVLVDTLGKADMRTFSVVSATHAWLGTSVKSAVAKWKFAPAEVAGCKVPRNYSLGISPRGKTPAAATTTKPATKKPAAKKPPVD
jgi:hypothetical protein